MGAFRHVVDSAARCGDERSLVRFQHHGGDGALELVSLCVVSELVGVAGGEWCGRAGHGREKELQRSCHELEAMKWPWEP